MFSSISIVSFLTKFKPKHNISISILYPFSISAKRQSNTLQIAIKGKNSNKRANLIQISQKSLFFVLNFNKSAAKT